MARAQSEPAGRSYIASQARLESLRQEIFRSFYLQAQGRASNATASMQSGFSKELDMMPSNDILTCLGDLLRVEMKNVLKMVMLAYDGDTDALAEIQVRGFRFETKPATEAAALADEIQALQIPSRTLEKELQKMVTRNVLENSGDDVIKKACDEIDAAPTIAEQQQAQGAQMFQQRFDQLNTR